jgi:mono/diheme cytochrome c family protein
MVLNRRRILVACLGLGLAIQLVPYRPKSNPTVLAEPTWNSERTRELFFRACKDCHSNETEWPWYAQIAPGSWLMRWDVDEARSHFNVSEWGRKKNHGDEAAEQVRNGDMPLWYYRPLHPQAQLSDHEREALVAGLVATFGDAETDPARSSGHERDHEAK